MHPPTHQHSSRAPQAAFLYKRAAILVSLNTATSYAAADSLYKSLPAFSVAHTCREMPSYLP